MKTRVLAVLLVLLVFSAACTGTANVALEVNETHVILTVSMTEDEVEDVVIDILVNGPDAFMTSANVDLRPGSIVLTGDVLSPLTGETVPGMVEVQAAAEGGQLKLAVTGFDVGALTAEQVGLDEFNAQLAAGLVDAMRDSNGATVDDVTITEDTISVSVKAPREDVGW